MQRECVLINDCAVAAALCGRYSDNNIPTIGFGVSFMDELSEVIVPVESF